jgi:outer membrane protein assembly factor BamA
MAKLRLYVSFTAMLFTISIALQAQYALTLTSPDKDSVFLHQQLGIPLSFKSQSSCLQYIYQLPSILQAKGYATASVDSIRSDSTGSSAQIFIGNIYRWTSIKTRKDDIPILEAGGWNIKAFNGKLLNFEQFERYQHKLLEYMENNGYPFARISLDSIGLTDSGSVSAGLKIEKGPLYKIDSIRVYGTAKISNEFLQRYLNMPNGSLFRKDRIEAVGRRILELPYVQEMQPSSVSMLSTGSVLNVYLKPKKSSEVNVLVGFLPASDQLTSSKLLVTGEAHVNLRNSLGGGETIGLNWQQIQVKSPRLDLLYQQPYLFKSPFGLNTSFSLFKKDSSYVNVNALIGVQYAATVTQTGSVFLQWTGSNLVTVDTLQVIATKQLPTIADISTANIGVTYEFNNTNYRFNPRRGNELQITAMVGTKKIKKNSVIEKLIDPLDSSFSFNSLYDTVRLSSYSFRVKATGAHYFPISRASTIKLGMNIGIYQSPAIFRNELFQIGGYRLLRGFDEESIYATAYATGTLEYRYLIGLNSFLFSFLDYGWAKNNVPGYQMDKNYLGFGIGLAFETKAGIFNISYAVGKQSDANLNLRQAKIHLGYVNIF